MKIILGDNQFFGINHSDLQKGNKTKQMFGDKDSIKEFIKRSLKIGLDGFMINSNKLGYDVVSDFTTTNLDKEIHYSIPYPHKYATLVNEEGMLYLLKYFLKNTSILKLILTLPKFILTRDIKYLIPIMSSLEIPKNLPLGSTIYIQNIITDMIIGIKRFDILENFVKDVRKKGYNPGLITLNPLKLDELIVKSEIVNKEDLVICFNINDAGFNVFPNRSKVENYIKSDHKYKLMGMSIFSSGGSNIKEAIDFIKTQKLDYVVFGSSNIKNIESNFNSLKK